MIIRLRSADGNFRVNVGDDVSISALYAESAQVLKMDQSQFTLSNQPNGSRPFQAGNDIKVNALGIRHGDLLYVTKIGGNSVTLPEVQSSQQQVKSQQSDILDNKEMLKLDKVDQLLSDQDGLIRRGKDERFCRHGPKGMCDYCMPLEPYDSKYLEEQKIKHMSFHAYLRKLQTQNVTKNAANRTVSSSGKFESDSVVPLLEEPSFKVNPNCDAGHPPYPASMCAKCQPSAIVLQQQVFRMVDHVEFESPAIIDQFLSFWRQSGLQRIGILYGKYEVHDKVPLGIKAVVSAVYEPPQNNGSDGVELLPDTQKAHLDVLSKVLDIRPVGVIYTDLIDDGSGLGKVICKRHVDSYFLSSAEIMFMAQQQLDNPSFTPHAKGHYFGSKFVSVVVSGDQNNDIHLSAYQVSNIGMGMVRDQVIEATMDPNSVHVVESSADNYVPEVFYKFKNKYGVTVQEAAKPCFPVEYLIVTLTEGFPQDPKQMFTSPQFFNIENRLTPSSMPLLKSHLSSIKCSKRDALNDFHLLLYLLQSSVFDENSIRALVELIYNKDCKDDEFEAKLFQIDAFRTLMFMLEEADQAQSGGTSQSAKNQNSQGEPWACPHCTFQNKAQNQDCEMCGLPKQ
ncbi:hypothetical protein MP228_013141 [Amoeboaphelidium protococcarum]|nr:hypothetical protein MP228_013141 [Amoeboaphelidium protococcarum]